MNQFLKQLTERQAYLKAIQTKIRQQLLHFPKGHLRVSTYNGKMRYYHVENTADNKGKYINQKNKELTCQLAQKDYYQKLEMAIETELRNIERLIKSHRENNPEEVFKKLNKYRQNLTEPQILSDDLFAKTWEEEPYTTNPYFGDEKIYLTKNNEYVRSKSEVFIADMYKELGIPYRYEAELILGKKKKKYPDFTLLNVKTREVIYHEHLGLIDDEEYRIKNMRKLNEYNQNGIYLGKNLIVTWEGSGNPFNISQVRKMIIAIFDLKVD